MIGRIKNVILPVTALFLLLVGIMIVQHRLDSRFLSSEQSVKELMYFPSARAVKIFVAGNELAVSDYLWLRMIQYYAYHMRSDRNYEYLYPIINNLTDLDPRFLYPYTFGALLLVHDARDSVNSLKLLDKAKKNNPQRWEFPYMKGFILYIFLGRPDEAVEEFVQASKLPDAWDGALRFAAFITKKQGKRETSRMMWRDIYDNSSSKQEREIAMFYLNKIDIEERLEILQELAVKYLRQYQNWPQSLEDLTAAGYIGPITPDPFGGQYYWSPKDQQVRNTIHDKFLKMIGK